MNPGLYQSIFNSKKLLPNLKIISIGDILIHSGDVICSDPFLSEHGCVDKLELLKGNYRLKLCIANLKHWGKRVSHAALLFSENEVVTWQKNEQGFPVDAGLACFMDSDTDKLFRKTVDEFYLDHPDGNYYDDVLAKEFKMNADQSDPRNIGDWDIHYPALGDPHNIGMFSSGLGDGTYHSYVGFDNNNKAVMIVIDFEIL